MLSVGLTVLTGCVQAAVGQALPKPSRCASAPGDEPKMKELDGGSDGVAGSSAETAG